MRFASVFLLIDGVRPIARVLQMWLGHPAHSAHGRDARATVWLVGRMPMLRGGLGVSPKQVHGRGRWLQGWFDR